MIVYSMQITFQWLLSLLTNVSASTESPYVIWVAVSCSIMMHIEPALEI